MMKQSAILTVESRELAKAFLVAPAVTIGNVSILLFPIGLFVFLFALPVAYLGAIVLGVPIYLILKRTAFYGWPYFVLGGMVCSIPGLVVFYKHDAPIVYSLQSFSTFSVLGMTGGFIFWWLYPRNREIRNKEIKTNNYGYIALAITVFIITYVYVMGSYEYITGKLTNEEHPFVSEAETIIKLEVDKNVVIARLPSGVPYRKNCTVGVAVWRELLSHEFVYSISYYPDVHEAHHYKWLTQEAKDRISKNCQ